MLAEPLMTQRAIFLAAITLAASACARSSTPPQTSSQADDPCSDFELSVEKTWNSERRVQLRASIMNQWGGELGAEGAQKLASSVDNKLDRVAQDWVMLRRSACRDHFARGVGTQAEYQQRVSCIDNVLQHQRGLVLELEAGSKTAVEQVNGLSGALKACAP